RLPLREAPHQQRHHIDIALAGARIGVGREAPHLAPDYVELYVADADPSPEPVLLLPCLYSLDHAIGAKARFVESGGAARGRARGEALATVERSLSLHIVLVAWGSAIAHEPKRNALRVRCERVVGEPENVALERGAEAPAARRIERFLRERRSVERK